MIMSAYVDMCTNITKRKSNVRSPRNLKVSSFKQILYIMFLYKLWYIHIFLKILLPSSFSLWVNLFLYVSLLYIYVIRWKNHSLSYSIIIMYNVLSSYQRIQDKIYCAMTCCKSDYFFLRIFVHYFRGMIEWSWQQCKSWIAKNLSLYKLKLFDGIIRKSKLHLKWI